MSTLGYVLFVALLAYLVICHTGWPPSAVIFAGLCLVLLFRR